jgi:hypothetical protein
MKSNIVPTLNIQTEGIHFKQTNKQKQSNKQAKEQMTKQTN